MSLQQHFTFHYFLNVSNLKMRTINGSIRSTVHKAHSGGGVEGGKRAATQPAGDQE